ncbi:amino acid/amide ABC transporter membrane protein 1, HAAT family [Faunimonas pinastri]|uniref:Amino acid/amide ABC transporter membrane protein 1, HAAT family n=1 Tax=Faunimonas pinastri TaxID=1855383 RepID=A0A1H9K5Y7_9HYPH|nr:branched-chain amino acid ABC transporter permease [Faunimonas pinastri]SEQ94571.1 amino acid/amide ABC transporter membrane protein 1, HAAT family [Faunimonas pinastri]
MFFSWANQILQGVLVGGLYAMFAMGLSLSVGIMRFVNIAHGDLIVLVSFLILSLTQAFGLDPILAVLITLPLAFLGGYLLQRYLLQRVIGEGVLPIILVTFGLSIIIQNGLLGTYGADTRKVAGGGIETATLMLGKGINVGVLPLAIFVTAMVMVAGLDLLLYRTRMGARIRAVSDDVSSANLVGLPSAHIYAIAMGIVGVTVAISAGFMSVWTNFDPTSGPSRLITAFEAVVLGGLGSLWGTLIGGIVLGVAQTLGAQFDAAWQVLAGHIVFLIIFMLRPQGLFPRN